MVTLTENATNEIKRLLAEAGGVELSVRIGLEAGGCSGTKYVITPGAARQADDVAASQFGLTVLCDPITLTSIEGLKIDVIAAAEARGFLFAPPLAMELGVGVVPVRKPGELPGKTIEYSYELEYGNARIEIHRDALDPGQRVLVVDDLLATGGTAAAAGRLIERLGGKVASYAFMIELKFLEGRSRLGDREIFSLLEYE